MNNMRKKLNTISKITIFIIFIFFTWLPIYIMIVNSLKSNDQILYGIMLPDLPFMFQNYESAFEKIIPYVLNSIFITTTSVIGVLIISSLAGFAFGRYQFKGKNILFIIIIANMMLPSVLVMVPSFLVINYIGLYDSYLALIIPYIVGGQVLGIFLVRGFVERIPSALFDAAKIDGAGEFLVLRKIGIPLIRPILGTIAILNVLNFWNDIVWPSLVIESEHKKTIAIGIADFNTFFGTEYGKMFAAFVIVSIPLLIFFLLNMKGFLNSLVEGAVK